MSTQPPIACTLAPGDFRDRLAWIADLNRTALLSCRQQRLTLELTYRIEAVDRVRELVRREQECCGFLRFALREEPDVVCLTIILPEDARDGLGVLFAPFLPHPCPPDAAPPSRAATHNAAGLGDRAQRRALSMTAAVALVCAAYCALPFALGGFAVTAFGTAIALRLRAYWWALGLASGAVVAGWRWITFEIRRRRVES